MKHALIRLGEELRALDASHRALLDDHELIALDPDHAQVLLLQIEREMVEVREATALILRNLRPEQRPAMALPPAPRPQHEGALHA